MLADIVVADLHFGYYLRQTAIERLREDVILPARTRGYQCISLVGISLGGFGALYYAESSGRSRAFDRFGALSRRPRPDRRNLTGGYYGKPAGKKICRAGRPTQTLALAYGLR